MVCLVYQETDAAARIAARTAAIRIAGGLNVAPQIAAIQIVATQTVVFPNAGIQIAVRVGIRVALIAGPAPLARDVRGVEFHAAVPKPAQVVRCVARAYWTAEHSRSFPVVARVSPILPALVGLTYPTYLPCLTCRERPQSEADPESQVVPVAARGLAAVEAQAEL